MKNTNVMNLNIMIYFIIAVSWKLPRLEINLLHFLSAVLMRFFTLKPTVGRSRAKDTTRINRNEPKRNYFVQCLLNYKCEKNHNIIIHFIISASWKLQRMEINLLHFLPAPGGLLCAQHVRRRGGRELSPLPGWTGKGRASAKGRKKSKENWRKTQKWVQKIQ